MTFLMATSKSFSHTLKNKTFLALDVPYLDAISISAINLVETGSVYFIVDRSISGMFTVVIAWEIMKLVKGSADFSLPSSRLLPSATDTCKESVLNSEGVARVLCNWKDLLVAHPLLHEVPFLWSSARCHGLLSVGLLLSILSVVTRSHPGNDSWSAVSCCYRDANNSYPCF